MKFFRPVNNLSYKRPLHRKFSEIIETKETNITNNKQSFFISYKQHGNPQNVLKKETQMLPNLKDTEILVRMVAAPINPADLNMIEGTYSIRPTLPAIGGNEGVGEVIEVGSKVKSLSCNDYVIPLKPGLGTWRNLGIFNEKDFLRVPNDIDPEYLATISVNPSTAVRLLEDFVQLNKGDVIIQNGSNSMVGMAVLQIANLRKIKTINIIRNRPNFADTIERLKALGGYIAVTEDYIKTPQFKSLISDLPKPKLALNCVGGDSATEMARILDNKGTMVTYGGMSRKPITIPTSQFIFKDITLKGFWLSKWIEEHSLDERSKMVEDLINLIRKEKLKLWMESWDFENFDKALSRVSEPYRDRKIVLRMR